MGNINKTIRYFICLALIVFTNTLTANEQPLAPIKVGVLKFGTVNWLLDVIKHHQLDKKHGVDLQVLPLGSKNATHVAIQGKAANVIVSDWIWVTRQRAERRDYTFVPYSNAVGTLMARPDSGIKTLSDLKDKKLGVAGGSVDKTWLLIQAYSQKKLGVALPEWVDQKFAAPPLLNKLAQRGDLDAVINFWHYTARLKAQGFIPILSLPEVLLELGIKRPIPVIGWVFSEQWAATHRDEIDGFLAASYEAQQILMTSDEEWLRIKPQMKAETPAMFTALRGAFRDGVASCFTDKDIQAAKSTFEILAKLGGKKLVGKSTQLSDGTFWENLESTTCP